MSFIGSCKINKNVGSIGRLGSMQFVNLFDHGPLRKSVCPGVRKLAFPNLRCLTIPFGRA